MGGITGITTNEKLADQYASNIVFALPMHDLGTVRRDVSFYCLHYDKHGSCVRVIPVPQVNKVIYNGSYKFDGSGDYLVPLQISDLAFGTGDFTVECWVYQTSNANDEDGIFRYQQTLVD